MRQSNTKFMDEMLKDNTSSNEPSSFDYAKELDERIERAMQKYVEKINNLSKGELNNEERSNEEAGSGEQGADEGATNYGSDSVSEVRYDEIRRDEQVPNSDS